MENNLSQITVIFGNINLLTINIEILCFLAKQL